MGEGGVDVSAKVNGQRVLSIEELVAINFLVAMLLAPVLERVAIYEAGRRASDPRPLWEPF